MSLISLFTRKAPTFNIDGGIISFDAVLEDTLEASVEYTSFPLEVGSNASDHGIIQPITWTITGLASNNPLGLEPSAITGFLTNFFDIPGLSAIAGLAAGFLSGSNETNAGATLQLLLGLMYIREPFYIDAVDIQLSNMVITNITRTKNPNNENGLEFTAELMELPLISTVITTNQPGQSQLRDFDPAKTQATALVKKGEVSTLESSEDTLAKAALIL